MPWPNGDLWPVYDRLTNAIDTLKTLSDFRADPMFQPSPFGVACTVSAAEQAVGVVKEMCDLLLSSYVHVTHSGPTRADLKRVLVRADLIKEETERQGE